MNPWLGKGEEAGLRRIDAKAGAGLSAAVLPWLVECPDPSLALANLERWLGAVSSPGAAAQQLPAMPATGQILLKVLGSSSELGSCLIQNPELASLVLDPSEIGRPITLDQLAERGGRLLASAVSYAHRLDRLRFLKQEALVRIAAADQARVWGPEECWLALSVLADALILLAREAAWSDFRASRPLPEACPLHIAGMGKLGGRELNYSSDIDLVYFVDDEATDELLRQATLFAEKLNRAISDPMGRGSLYRVDMRLRPYGRSGHLVIRQKALEGYMERHAETWEHMALIRSRVVAGSREAAARWDEMREKACFSRPRGDWRIDEILHMRRRLEEKSSDRDLKRAPGGIRDVEFTVQILQLLHGQGRPGLHTAGTLDALEELVRLGVIPQGAARDLREGCLFLRAVEHQVQVEAGRQTHETPEGEESRLKLALRMGFASLSEFDLALAGHRSRIRHWHEALLGARATTQARGLVLERSGALAPAIASWIDSLPSSESLYESLAENQSSLGRMRDLIARAPALAPWLHLSDSVTEQVMSGEVMEPPSPPGPPFDGARLRNRWLRAAARTALGLEKAFPREQGASAEAVIRHLAPPEAAVIALGSFAEGELSLESDLDLVLVARDSSIERSAARFRDQIADLKVQGSPVAIDLRLRPEGRQGPLAATLPYLTGYAASRLEAWEIVAASRARLSCGPEDLFQAFLDLVVRPGLTPAQAREALRIKGRVERERARRLPGKLDIKLGPGGLDDAVWTLHLLALTHPGAEPPDRSLASIAEALAAGGILPREDAAFLVSHAAELSRARRTLALCGMHDSLLPSDGDKLNELGLEPSLPERCRAARAIMEERLQAGREP